MKAPSPRQKVILRSVVDGYVATGAPVGSKWLAGRSDLSCGASTVRAELAALEEMGYLAHPHTSAGRVPSEAGYRYYADMLMSYGVAPVPTHLPLNLSVMRREVDVAMDRTAEALSQVTDLLAVVSAPPLRATTIKHVEVLLLQPNVVMVVAITSTGGVTKRIIPFRERVDPGLVDWAASYLNERLCGMTLGAKMLLSRLVEPTLSETEQGFLDALQETFTDLEEMAGDNLYMHGAGRLLEEDRFQDLSEINDLMGLLERRFRVLRMLRSALDERRVYLRIGHENDAPELRAASVVAANYGLAHRNLGTVGVIGPLRMDYATAIGSVQEAAAALSRFVEDLYQA